MLKKVPHTFTIVFSIIVVAAIATWLIPSGKYIPIETEVDGKVTTQLIFHYHSDLPQEVKENFTPEPQTWQIFSALYKGFVKQSNIIIFILMIGGAFWIMNQSRAIDMGILAFINKTRRIEHHPFMRKIGVDNLIMILIMLMFSAFGAIFGMSEETIAFVIIIVPLAISMGYDSIVGVCLVYVAAHLGFAGAILNPFTIGIAQGLVDIPLFSGIEYRIFCWVIINVVGITWILVYANRIKKNPTQSLVYDEDEYWRKREQEKQEQIQYYTPKSAWGTYFFLVGVLSVFAWLYPSTTISIGNSSVTLVIIPILAILFALIGFFALRKSVHFFILLLLGYTILFLIVGVMGYGWYVMEIATLFLAMGVAAGVSMGKGANDISKLFLEGVKDILSAAIIVGLAGGIIIVLEDGGVIDSILYGLSKAMGNFGRIASVGTMYVVQTFLNIIIPSGSAKAAITMPIMAPFGDLIGVSRQATVMAFQFGDGFTNMITPTSGVLIAVLGVARVPYHKWVKWVWPFIITVVILGFLLLIPTVLMNLNGF